MKAKNIECERLVLHGGTVYAVTQWGRNENSVYLSEGDNRFLHTSPDAEVTVLWLDQVAHALREIQEAATRTFPRSACDAMEQICAVLNGLDMEAATCGECEGRGCVGNPGDDLGTETCPNCAGTGRE